MKEDNHAIGCFRVDNTNAKEIGSRLRNTQAMQKVSVSYDVISTNSMKFLADGLEYNRSISDLEISSVFNESELKILCRGIKRNTSLTRVAIEFYRMNDEGAISIAEMLKENQNIQVLHLQHMKRPNYVEAQMSEVGIAALAEALKVNRSLIQLHLINNSFSTVSAKHLAEAIKENTGLAMLKLHACDVNDVGAGYIADALAINKTLKWLDLEKNRISALGTQKIAEVLHSNSALAGLNLSQNNLGEDGLLFIVKALISNRTVQHLNVSKVGGEVGGAEIIGQLLRGNDFLTSLYFKNNNIGKQGAVFIAEGLKDNSHLRVFCLIQ